MKHINRKEETFQKDIHNTLPLPKKMFITCFQRGNFYLHCGKITSYKDIFPIF